MTQEYSTIRHGVAAAYIGLNLRPDSFDPLGGVWVSVEFVRGHTRRVRQSASIGVSHNRSVEETAAVVFQFPIPALTLHGACYN